MNNFESFGLSDDLNKSLAKMEYTTPTPIQAQAIPMAMKGRDILGSAQTGTGKTAAFSIPLVESLMNNPMASALVLTPTRELAKQVLDVIKQLVHHRKDLKTAFIIGGDSMGKQLAQLNGGARIVVGTPGRVNDHLRRGSLNLKNTGFLVLDETDRMLDMGFGVQLDEIAKFLPKERQTLMFSATLPHGIVKLSEKYLANAERISMGDTNVVAPKIKQEVMRIEQPQKYTELVNQLTERTGSVIVFVKTKHGADKMARNLRKDGFESDALHGDLRQNKRDKVMNNFRNMKFRILVATDIASRGLDVPHIEHVINFDLPQVPEDYIHRMGRTARAGAEGSALCFVASHDAHLWNAIECLLDPSIKRQGGPQGRGRGGNRSNGGKGRGGKPFGAKRPDFKGGNRPSFRSDKPAGGRNDNRGDRNERNDRPNRDNRSEKTAHFNRDDRGPREERSYNNDRPKSNYNDRSNNDRPKRDFKSDRPKFDRDNRPNRDFKSDRPQSDRPRSDRGDANGNVRYEKKGGYNDNRNDNRKSEFASNKKPSFAKDDRGGFKDGAKSGFKKRDGGSNFGKPAGNKSDDTRGRSNFKSGEKSGNKYAGKPSGGNDTRGRFKNRPSKNNAA